MPIYSGDGEKGMGMTLTTQNTQLPATMDDLAKFVLIGRDRMAAVRAEISAINRLGLAQEVREQKLAEAQQISEVVLDAEVKLGQLIAAMPKAKNQYESALPNVGKSKKEALSEIGFSTSQADRLETLAKHPEIVAQAKAEAREQDDIVSRSFVLEKIKAKQKAEQIEQAKESIAAQAREFDHRPVIHIADSTTFDLGEKYDLLLTDPPYSTDVDDLDKFIKSWHYRALDGVKPKGFAYIFIGAYPNELQAYLNAPLPEHITLEQVLVWTYKNTLGNNPKGRYKQNYQAILFYRGIDAPDLDCPLTTEQWAVQEINAPDGRQGDRYHAWQKPMEIAERFIRHSTKPGDTVFDPFACTGTFVLAASKLGRIGIGVEVNHDNAQIAKDRGCSVWG
jgi:hypothetical protein